VTEVGALVPPEDDCPQAVTEPSGLVKQRGRACQFVDVIMWDVHQRNKGCVPWWSAAKAPPFAIMEVTGDVGDVIADGTINELDRPKEETVPSACITAKYAVDAVLTTDVTGLLGVVTLDGNRVEPIEYLS
jgi:hypothetical protein